MKCKKVMRYQSSFPRNKSSRKGVHVRNICPRLFLELMVWNSGTKTKALINPQIKKLRIIFLTFQQSLRSRIGKMWGQNLAHCLAFFEGNQYQGKTQSIVSIVVKDDHLNLQNTFKALFYKSTRELARV